MDQLIKKKNSEKGTDDNSLGKDSKKQYTDTYLKSNDTSLCQDVLKHIKEQPYTPSVALEAIKYKKKIKYFREW